MISDDLLPVARFIQTLEIVERESGHLNYSWNRLFCREIDVSWVEDLENNPELAERMEAFISRFGRIQDTIADKLLPRWLRSLAEEPGSHIEVLNRAERLGVLQSTENWLQARHLRNRLIHEYMTDAAAFAEDLILAKEYSLMFGSTYNQVRQFAIDRMGLSMQSLPPESNWT